MASSDDWSTDADFINDGKADGSGSTAMMWTKLAPLGSVPSPRQLHAAAICNNTLYVFGGQLSCGVSNELFALDLQTNEWREVAQDGNIPEKRFGHSLTCVGHVLYMFGGQTTRNVVGGMHCFDTETGVWESAKQTQAWAPPPRTTHAAVAVGDQIVLFGGQGRDHDLSDMYAFNTVDQKWTKLQDKEREPEVRRRHSLAYWGEGSAGRVVTFAGFQMRPNNRGEYFDDLYSFDLSSSTWHKHVPSGPVPLARGGHHAVCTSDGHMVVMGGWGSDRGDYDGIHFMDLKEETLTWCGISRLGGRQPPSVYHHSMTVTRGHGLESGGECDKIYVFGGALGGKKGDELMGDVWVLDVDLAVGKN